MNNELAKLKELTQTQDLLIANGQLTTYLLRQLADNEIDADCFSVVSECESYGKETDAELSITDFAARAACYVDALIERLEAAEVKVKELTTDLDKESEIRHRIHEELNAIKGEQRMQLAKVDIRGDGFWGRMAARESIRANKAEAELAAIKVKQKPVGAFHISGGEVEATSDYIEPGNWPVNDGIVEVYAHPAPPLLPTEPKETDCPEWIADPFSWACGAGWMRDKAIAMGAKPMPVIVLKGGSLKSDGNIWYKSETVVQLIRAAGLEVKS